MDKLFTRCFIFLLFVVSFSNVTFAQKEIGAYDVDKYIDKYVCVYGTIVQAYKSSSGNIFLNFEEEYPNQPFVAVIFSDNYSEISHIFNNLYENLIGKRVKVFGVIKVYDEQAEIIISSSKQLEIISNKD